MSLQPPAQIRLGQPGATGTNLYNTYHVLAQLASLYAKARDGEQDSNLRDQWLHLTDSTLGDVGMLVHLWQSQIKTTTHSELRCLDDEVIGRRIIRLVRRMELIESRASIWSGSCRFAKILLLCETHWRRLLNSFASIEPTLRSQFTDAFESGSRRVEMLQGIETTMIQKRARLDKKYVVPVLLPVSPGRVKGQKGAA